MSRLLIVTYLWGKAFTAQDVEKLAAGFRRNLRQDHTFVVVTDAMARFEATDIAAVSIPTADLSLLDRPGCFARLRLFDSEFQARLDRVAGAFGRLACVDLDTVVTGDCDPLFDRNESFVIMQGGNSANPNPYGGALMMLRSGAHPDVWSDFSLSAAAEIPHFAFPDDQGWLAAKIPGAAAWKVGAESGVYCFRKPGWPGGSDLPAGARLVTFRGNNPPAKHAHLEWIKTHWRT